MKPFVSVIIPVRNEEQFIEKCIKRFFKSDYPREQIEILIVDGMSNDNTGTIVKELQKTYANLRLLDNPKKITPVALNIGIKASKGDIIMISGAHSEVPTDYISKCVKHLAKSNADNVGGIIETKARLNTLKGKAIAEVLSSPFGVGGSKFRTGTDKPIEVDTVPFGCYKKEVFEKIGFFNEELIRNQDIDLNLRLKRAGGKIMLFPDIKLTYYARSTFKELWKNNFGNGYWVLFGSKFAKTPFSLRHLIPLFFVIFIIGGTILSVLSKMFFPIYLIILSIYLLGAMLFSSKIARSSKKAIIFIPALLSFFVLHFSYGLGSIMAGLSILLRKH